ncbi:MAG: gephyrin-like molybdotransferase Glp [Pseudomonadota bacterium]|jgi:molybdopterin molybdotransferase
MTVPLRDCCFDQRGALASFEAARRAALELASPCPRTEHVPLARAMGRTLAIAIAAPRALPAFDQAAMDGYALAATAVQGVPRVLPVSGCTRAGDPPGVLAPGSAHRILTGAALPAGADTVVMQEDVRWRDHRVQIDASAEAGTHIRHQGEDVAAGAVVLPAGRVLGWAEIALLAALGVGDVLVRSPLRVALITTGSELCSPGEALRLGAIYDSNTPMLSALLAGPDIHLTSVMVPDDEIAVARALATSADNADVILTTAGMSVGEEDHVRAAVRRTGGALMIEKVAMKPGKPLALGRLGSSCFIGLPGNPQAAACGVLAFVRPMLARLLGRPAQRPLTAVTAFACAARPDRTELLPVRLGTEAGRLTAHRSGPEGSHRLLPMVAADAVAIVPAGMRAGPGVCVEVLPFDPMRCGA